MSDNSHSLSVTLKGGTGYDSPWIVVYGDDPAEVSEKLKNLGDLVEQTVITANLLKGANNAAPLAPGGAEAAAPTAAPPAQKSWGQAPAAAPTNGGPVDGAVHPTDVCQSCGQSPRYKNITAKSGKQFQLWSCPNQRQRGDGHYSEFAN